jgi:hypothetical protein
MKTKEGIKEDDNLYDCYNNCERDILQLKKEERIRYIVTNNPHS